ncbi:hypothetical protein ABFS83_06G175600 [Erythranthe nasuta]
MSCFPCFQKKEEESSNENNNDLPIAQPKDFTPPSASPPPPVNNSNSQDPLDDNDDNIEETEHSAVKSFTFRELATATKNFRQECLLGEGGFGKVFKGTLVPSGQVVAVRQLDRNGVQGGKDFVLELSNLSFLHHQNLVKIIGYCADGDQRLLVYEYLSSGSLKNHLFDLPAGKKPIDWSTRMKVALGIAEGLEYLHEKADPPIIYRDLKSSNILLDDANNPRLSEYGLAKLVQSGNKMQPRVMAGYGYCAPEYERQGELTLKSDVYSFGVVLLELITGRPAMDTSRPTEEQNLVSWAQPIFRDPSKFPDMADPLLRKQFNVTGLNQAVGVAAMCLQEEPSARPLISDISAALSFLAMAPPEAPIPARLVPILSSRVDNSTQFGSIKESTSNNNSNASARHNQEDFSDSEDEDGKTNHGKDKYDDKSSSDYEYGDSSDDNSDYEEREEEDNQKPVPKRDPSKKLGSSSKRKSRKKSVRIKSRSDSSAKSTRQDIIHESHHNYESGSSSDGEHWNESHTKSFGVNSRSKSKGDSHDDN